MNRNRPLYVIAYDISCPRRLQRVARLLEKHALRAQKSVFLFHGERAAVERLLDETARVMNLREDIVQAWQVAPGKDANTLLRGTSAYTTPASLVLGPHERLVISEGTED